jgi:hypothetical protein
MKPALEEVFGYQGDTMNLPVADLAAALPFYERMAAIRPRMDAPFTWRGSRRCSPSSRPTDSASSSPNSTSNAMVMSTGGSSTSWRLTGCATGLVSDRPRERLVVDDDRSAQE